LRGYAWDHAGQLWYESLPLLRKDSGFRDAAQATLKTAGRLFGDASKEQQAVHEVSVLRRSDPPEQGADLRRCERGGM
jgi:Zn-dependent metalloprotease